MKIKTSELTDAALDWAVIKAVYPGTEPTAFWVEFAKKSRLSENWGLSGPILEREHITVVFRNAVRVGTTWSARISQDDKTEDGPTALIAAMRCLVAAKLGDEIDVPGELT